jgi:hypothetical protein
MIPSSGDGRESTYSVWSLKKNLEFRTMGKAHKPSDSEKAN